MERGADLTPMEEVAEAAEEAVLGDEWTAGSATEEGVDGSMVVQVQVNSEVLAVGSNGEGFEGCKEFSRLLGENPRGAGEEAQAHIGFPDANKVGSPRGPRRVCKVAGS